MKVSGFDVSIRQLHGSILIPFSLAKGEATQSLAPCRLSLARSGGAALTSLMAKVAAALRKSTGRHRRVAATS